MPKTRIYHLQYRPHKPVDKRRWVGWSVTRVQEWLEGGDKPLAKVVAYSLLTLTALYFLTSIIWR